jgi:hypothetical protein
MLRLVVAGSTVLLVGARAAAQCDETTKLIDIAGVADDHFGYAVDVSGEFAIVGGFQSEGTAPDSGAAFVFERTSQGWVQIDKLVASDGGAVDRFGWAVAISGDTAIVGAGLADAAGTDSGAAYIFRDDGTGNWVEIDKLVASDGAPNDYFGLYVDLDSDLAIIGAWAHDAAGADSGSGYIFRDAGNGDWVQVAKLTPQGARAGDYLGAVAIDGATAVLGGLGDDSNGDDSGAAFVFQESDGGDWDEVQKLVASDGEAGDYFGDRVGVNAETIVVGAYRANQFGSAYIFEKDGGIWNEVARLNPVSGQFGYAVDVRGDTIAVGGWRDDAAGRLAGAVYTYGRTGPGQWVQEQMLTASDPEPFAYFGSSVALGDDALLVGAPSGFGDANGPGAAYAFACDADTDGDGLLDSWESENGGIDINADGVIDLDLYALGARPDHKDLFVEIDVMDGGSFSQAALDEVIDAFEFAPVDNPDGITGVELHAIVDETDLPYASVWDDEFINYGNIAPFYFGTPAERVDPNAEHILDAKRRAFRYCILVDDIEGTTLGIAERPGNDMYVGLGGLSAANVNAYRTFEWWFAHVFMHELGHTLGLTHGGGEDPDPNDPGAFKVVNYKPNYASVMNYNFDSVLVQGDAGGTSAPIVTYSLEALPPLDESNLDETIGVATRLTAYEDYFIPFSQQTADGSTPTGWLVLAAPGQADADYNGDLDTLDVGVVADLNLYGVDDPTPGETMNGHNDWANLQYAIGTGGAWDEFVHIRNPAPELSDEMATRHRESTPPPPFGCRADITLDGMLNSQDFVAFLNLFVSGKGAADFTLDGTVNSQDFVAFLNDFVLGC